MTLATLAATPIKVHQSLTYASLNTGPAAACVARGAAYLDETRPGWAARIDTETLNMSSTTDCVLGQLNNGDYWSAPEIEAADETGDGARKWGIKHGFWANKAEGAGHPCFDPGDFGPGLDYEDDRWVVLDTLWLNAIADRRAA